jgi:hypothetical protein
MRWEPKKVYLYLVSLVTFIMLLVGSWNLVNTIVEIAFPVDDHYVCPPHAGKDGGRTEPTEEDKQRCEEERERHKRNQQGWTKRRLIQNSLFLVIVVPAYLYHWRAARRADQS